MTRLTFRLSMGAALLACLGLGGCDDGYGDEPGGDGVGDEGSGGGGGGDDGAADDGAADDGADDGGDDGGDDAADDAGDGEDEPAGDEGGDALSFATDILPIITASCGCHTGAAPSAGLDLNAEAAYAALVEAASGAGLVLVTPGNSGQSYLVNKLDGSMADVGGGGAQMPMGGMLDEDDTQKVVDWIDAGAPE